MSAPIPPPKFVLKFLRWFCREDFLDEVEGNLVELFEKRADRAMIIVSHDAAYVRDHCSKVGVLYGGAIAMFDDADEAYAYYNHLYSNA